MSLAPPRSRICATGVGREQAEVNQSLVTQSLVSLYQQRDADERQMSRLPDDVGENEIDC